MNISLNTNESPRDDGNLHELGQGAIYSRCSFSMHDNAWLSAMTYIGTPSYL